MSTRLFFGNEADGPKKPLESATWLPQRAYTDPGFYDAETQNIFLKEWMGVFHRTSLPKVGDFRTMDILGRPLLFVHDTKGRIRCYINVCRHRGMAIATGEGNCKGFVCPYHTWAYDLDGRVIRTPQIKGGWANGDVRLSEVRTDLMLGYVFINFDPSAAPLADSLGGVARELAAWGDADLEVLFDKTYVCRCNWKLMWENAIEAYHVLGTHRDSIQEHIPSELAYVTAPEGESQFVVLHTPYKSAGTNPFGVQTHKVPTISNLPPWALKESRFYTLWPCSQFSTGSESLNAVFLLPGDNQDEHIFVWAMAVSRGAREQPDYEAYKAEQIAYADLIMKEDLFPCERIARTYAGCNEWKPGPYAPNEKVCWNFHRWYLDKIGEKP